MREKIPTRDREIELLHELVSIYEMERKKNINVKGYEHDMACWFIEKTERAQKELKLLESHIRVEDLDRLTEEQKDRCNLSFQIINRMLNIILSVCENAIAFGKAE